MMELFGGIGGGIVRRLPAYRQAGLSYLVCGGTILLGGDGFEELFLLF